MAGIGTHEELMKKCEIYQEIVRSQNDRGEKKTDVSSEKIEADTQTDDNKNKKKMNKKQNRKDVKKNGRK